MTPLEQKSMENGILTLHKHALNGAVRDTFMDMVLLKCERNMPVTVNMVERKVQPQLTKPAQNGQGFDNNDTLN